MSSGSVTAGSTTIVLMVGSSFGSGAESCGEAAAGAGGALGCGKYVAMMASCAFIAVHLLVSTAVFVTSHAVRHSAPWASYWAASSLSKTAKALKVSAVSWICVVVVSFCLYAPSRQAMYPICT